MREGVHPSDWKEAQVTPLFKKGEKGSLGNCRPVSLTSVICKVMAGIVRVSLIDHLNSNELLSGRQRGFVSERSCVTNLLATLEDWTSLLDSGSSVDAIYLDFSKAFDSFPHERLKVILREKYFSLACKLNLSKCFNIHLKVRKFKSKVINTSGEIIGTIQDYKYSND